MPSVAYPAIDMTALIQLGKEDFLDLPAVSHDSVVDKPCLSSRINQESGFAVVVYIEISVGGEDTGHLNSLIILEFLSFLKKKGEFQISILTPPVV